MHNTYYWKYQKFWIKFFYIFEISILCSSGGHLFDQKYNQSINQSDRCMTKNNIYIKNIKYLK